MPRKSILLGAGCLTLLALSSPRDASATPAFARQTSQSCAACHFQRYPLLNSYGRKFKTNGYTQVGKQGTIEDKGLSLPTTLNAALVSKFRYQKTNGAATTGEDGELNAGQLQVPDEASLFLAGRVAKNIGFQADISVSSGGSGLAGFKVPFVFPSKDFTFLAVPFFTDAQGAAYGFELLNTGAVEYSRAFENAKETSAQQYIVKDANEELGAIGAAFVVHHKYGYFSYTPYVASKGTTAPRRFISYFRGVVTPEKVGNFDMAAGVQFWKGVSTTGAVDEEVTKHADVWAVDAQAQGNVGDLPLGVYLAYGSAAKSGATENAFNTSTVANRSAFTVAAELGVVPSKFALGLGYRKGNSGDGGNDSENALTLGATYNIAKNVAFQLNHSIYSYGSDVEAQHAATTGDQKTTFVVFSAF
jgi:hypothetical protein